MGIPFMLGVSTGDGEMGKGRDFKDREIGIYTSGWRLGSESQLKSAH